MTRYRYRLDWNAKFSPIRNGWLNRRRISFSRTVLLTSPSYASLLLLIIFIA